MLRAILTNARLLELKPGAVRIACGSRYLAGARQRAAEITQLMEKELGARFDLSIEESDSDAAPGGDVSGGEPGAAPSPQAGAPIDDPLVKLAAELFNGRIVAVQPRTIPRQ